ncbi:MAG: urease accessory protein UreD [Alphaproteobacteria bacterium]
MAVRFARRDDRTVLGDLYQQGSAKARFPKVYDGGPAEVVLINTAGGVTGADCYQQSVDFDEGTRAVVTTQAAEKVYKASEGASPARIANKLTAKAAAFAEWLPQETIFFDRGRLHRRFEARLDPTARLLACEAIVFGRTAMGETVESGSLRDDWRITVGDRVVFADSLAIDGAVQACLDRPAVTAGGRALATVLYVGPDSERLIDMAKDALGPFTQPGKRAAASRIDDLIVARFIAADGLSLRPMLDTYLSTIRYAAGQHGSGKSTPQPAAGGVPKLWCC